MMVNFDRCNDTSLSAAMWGSCLRERSFTMTMTISYDHEDESDHHNHDNDHDHENWHDHDHNQDHDHDHELKQDLYNDDDHGREQDHYNDHDHTTIITRRYRVGRVGRPSGPTWPRRPPPAAWFGLFLWLVYLFSHTNFQCENKKYLSKPTIFWALFTKKPKPNWTWGFITKYLLDNILAGV